MIANAIENLLLVQLRGCGVDDLPRCHDQGMGLVAGDLERPGLRAVLCPGGGYCAVQLQRPPLGRFNLVWQGFSLENWRHPLRDQALTDAFLTDA